VGSICIGPCGEAYSGTKCCSCSLLDNDEDNYTNDVDCNDNNPAINPGALELCGNGIDENCDGLVDENCDNNCSYYYWFDNVSPACGYKQFCGSYMYYGLHTFLTEEECLSSLNIDNDGDNYTSNVDCNDNNSAIHPGALETCKNNVDDDCDGQVDENCDNSPSHGSSSNKKEEICYPNLQCSGWSDCVDGIQTRTCEDLDSCENSLGENTENRLCESYQVEKIALEPKGVEKENSLWVSLGGGGFLWTFLIGLFLLIIVILLIIFLVSWRR